MSLHLKASENLKDENEYDNRLFIIMHHTCLIMVDTFIDLPN